MIVWPIYEIRKHKKVWEDNKVLYITSEYNIEYILDNRNLSGNTLGIRRMRLVGEKLYPLKKVCFTFYDVLQCKSRLFIDSSGIFVKLEKRYRRDLTYHKVLDYKILPDNTTICKCKDIFTPIKIPFIVKGFPRFLGLLKMGGDFHLYEISNEYKRKTWRLL
jgi:hypothetical protein